MQSNEEKIRAAINALPDDVIHCTNVGHDDINCIHSLLAIRDWCNNCRNGWELVRELRKKADRYLTLDAR